MRIAQVAPLFESVPPSRYGGTERVVAYLTDELVRRGHEVTLYASGDSRTSAELVPLVPKALRLEGAYTNATVFETIQLESVLREARRYDIIHFHTSHVHYPATRRLEAPTLTTLHGRLDIPELSQLYWTFNDTPVVSISEAQRAPVPHANWQATVYHGLPLDLFRYNGEPESYFAFVGRISSEKRVDRAIEIATAAQTPLRIAAKVDPADRAYHESEIRPLLDNPLVDFIGEVDDEGKQEVIGGAKALLFPIDWPEPFGLAMIESMACGTPVIAFRRGSVPEVVDDGATGFVVESVEEATRAVRRVDDLSRHRVRTVFEQRFTAERMARDYVDAYTQIVAGTSLGEAAPLVRTSPQVA